MGGMRMNSSSVERKKRQSTEVVPAPPLLFSLDNGRLIVTIGKSKPIPVAANKTHALLNLLYASRQEIIDANEEAQVYGSGKKISARGYGGM